MLTPWKVAVAGFLFIDLFIYLFMYTHMCGLRTLGEAMFRVLGVPCWGERSQLSAILSYGRILPQKLES